MNVHCISDIEDVELIEVTSRYIDGVCLQTTTGIKVVKVCVKISWSKNYSPP